MATFKITKVQSQVEDSPDSKYRVTLWLEDVDTGDKVVQNLIYEATDGLVAAFYASPFGAANELQGVPG